MCRLAGQPRSTQRYRARGRFDEEQLRGRIVALALDYGAYGYRMLAGLLRGEGLLVNHKRVERIWRQEGLKVPKRQPKRGRLWLNEGSCIRLRPQHPAASARSVPHRVAYHPALPSSVSWVLSFGPETLISSGLFLG